MDNPLLPDSLSDPVSAPPSLPRPQQQHMPHPGCPDSLNCLADSDSKPRDTFATIIRCAILSTQSKRMTLSCIYSAIEEKYPYYRDAGTGWKNTVRHVLSTSQQFEKSRRPITEPGKGGYWSVNKTASKTDANSRKTRPQKGPPRKAPILQPPPSTPPIWQHPIEPSPQDYPYNPNNRAPLLAAPGQPTPPDNRNYHPMPIPPQTLPLYSDHHYSAAPSSQIPSFQPPNPMIYAYDKPMDRPGWMSEVSWGNSPMGNVATNGRQ